MDNLGSSIPAGTSVYRFPPVSNVLNGSDVFTGVAATIVHEMKAFRDFNPNLSQRSFLVNLKTHVNVTLDPQARQQVTSPRFLAFSADPFNVSILAERMQLGYVYRGDLINRAPDGKLPGEVAFAPQTDKTSVSDTQTSSAGVHVSEGGASVGFDVTDTLVVSINDWAVALSPVAGQVDWDYYIQHPYDGRADPKSRQDHRPETFPNLSLVGFSFDTSAWFEIFLLSTKSLEFQPVFKLQVGHLQRTDQTITINETRYFGDENFPGSPFKQPKLSVDLTKVPMRSLGP